MAGTISGTSSTANVDTTTAAPGTYTVKGHVSQGVQAGPDRRTAPRQFTVKAFEPPTISCSANPSSVNPGDQLDDYGQRSQPAEPSSDLQLQRNRRFDQQRTTSRRRFRQRARRPGRLR